MKINNNIITAEDGKILKRISDGILFGKSISLGYTYYINNVLLDTPLLEKPEDYEEVDEEADIVDNSSAQEQSEVTSQNDIKVETTEELQPYLDEMIQTITEYDSSENVNCFYINDQKEWFTVGVRNTYKNSIEAAELLGDENISFIVDQEVITLKTSDAKLMLAKVQRYADNCSIVTAKHKIDVAKLTSSDAIKTFDYKSGYPDKLNFTI